MNSNPTQPVANPAGQLADGSVRKLPSCSIQAEKWGSIAVLLPIGLALTAVGLGLSFMGPLDGPYWWIPLPILGFLFFLFTFLAFKWPAIQHKHFTWSLSPLRIEIKSGVIWRSVTSVPRSRIQHTDVGQGPIQRRFGLSTLSIHTAGSDSAQVDLSGITYEDALAIRDYLLLRETTTRPSSSEQLENPWAALVNQKSNEL